MTYNDIAKGLRLLAANSFKVNPSGTVVEVDRSVLVYWAEAVERSALLSSRGGVADVWSEIAAERARQITAEGWSIKHDDQHSDRELMLAAMCYLGHVRGDIPMQGDLPVSWPWDRKWWKPKDRQRDLVRAGALMLAERDRLTRLGQSVGHVDHKLNIVVNMLSASPATPTAQAHDEGHPHLINGEFQSDKYPTCPRGKVPLSVKDKTAQDLLWKYAQRRRAVDAEFTADLEIALKSAGYFPFISLSARREG